MTLQPARYHRSQRRHQLLAGLLTLAAVCIAIVPIPFTGYICFPAAAILAAVTALNGVRALRRFRMLSGAEKGMATAGTAAGATGL